MSNFKKREFDRPIPLPPIASAKIGDKKRITISMYCSKEYMTYTATVEKVLPYFVVCRMSPGGYRECFLHSDWNNSASAR